MNPEETLSAFERFVAEQAAARPDLVAVNLQVEEQSIAEQFAKALCARGWNAEAGKGMTWNAEANEFRLVHLVTVMLREEEDEP